jgi:hypothetical protein
MPGARSRRPAGWAPTEGAIQDIRSRWGAVQIGTWLLLVGLAAVLIAAPWEVEPGPAPPTLVIGSVPFRNPADDTDLVLAHQDSLNQISPGVYGIAQSGRIVPHLPEQTAPALDRLRDSGISLMPTLANVTDGKRAYSALAPILQDRRHQVWFENAEGTAAKLDMVKRAGIRGVYLWMAGGPDARTWAQVRAILPVRPVAGPAAGGAGG